MAWRAGIRTARASWPRLECGGRTAETGPGTSGPVPFLGSVIVPMGQARIQASEDTGGATVHEGESRLELTHLPTKPSLGACHMPAALGGGSGPHSPVLSSQGLRPGS